MAASLGFAPAWPHSRWPILPLAAGLAAALELGDQVKLKWPNDLLLGGEKLGGILVESTATLVVVGCGVNLWWPDAPEGITGLYPEDPGPDRHVDIAIAWADRFLESVGAGWARWGREEYRARCETLGRLIVWEPAGMGQALDIDEEGRLVVETDQGRRQLTAGEVRHVRTP
jgi:BirA family biotin operon repressor/biotin-[acetyl-CoA-carboxylase] ligase